MGYIRSNEDYYIAQGMTPRQAEIQCEMDRLGADRIDHGYCNPIKAKLAADEEDCLRKKAEHTVSTRRG